jgi:hypothetical protein
MPGDRAAGRMAAVATRDETAAAVRHFLDERLALKALGIFLTAKEAEVGLLGPGDDVRRLVDELHEAVASSSAGRSATGPSYGATSSPG